MKTYDCPRLHQKDHTWTEKTKLWTTRASYDSNEVHLQQASQTDSIIIPRDFWVAKQLKRKINTIIE